MPSHRHRPYLILPSIQVDERVFVSGQIGLVPCSMSIPAPQNLATEVPLASQHADRIVKALSSGAGGGWDGHAQLLLYWVAQERHISHAIAAAQRLDVSLRKSYSRKKPNTKNTLFSLMFFFLGGGHGGLLLQRDATPTLFLAVKGLPKDALIEKQVLYHTGRGFSAADDEGDTAPVSCLPVYGTGILDSAVPSNARPYLIWMLHRNVLRRRHRDAIRCVASSTRHSLCRGDLRQRQFELGERLSSPRCRSSP